MDTPMDHDHGGHGGHGGHDHAPALDACSMNMLFTWDATNLCIVFRWWRIRSLASLLASLLAVVVLAMGYEAMRSVSRRYESAMNRRIAALPRHSQGPAGQRAHVIKASLYGLQNFYAFMLMLVFMTYNGWVMLAVSLGAFLGYLVFGQDSSATKENACH